VVSIQQRILTVNHPKKLFWILHIVEQEVEILFEDVCKRLLFFEPLLIPLIRFFCEEIKDPNLRIVKEVRNVEF
jgi:hypothetical protein